MAPATRARTATTPKRSYSENNSDEEQAVDMTPKKQKKKKAVAASPKKERAIAIPATPDPAPTLETAARLVEDSNDDDSSHIVVRPQLSFDYKAAKRHLIAADARFGPMLGIVIGCVSFSACSIW